MAERKKKKALRIINDSSSDDPKINKGLESEYKGLDCSEEKYYSQNCNQFLLKKEVLERNYLDEHNEENPSLYPTLNDTNFNIKIASKREFNDTKYDGPDFNKSIKEQADLLANADFELQPHQAFVKNFMSFQTPYNSLLLYHGLGSGKTCSAIGVCEEMREYTKQIGITKRIIIVASENVQENFKLQMFDERKLKLVDGLWNIRACTGNSLLKEINPMNMRGLSKEKITSQIKNLINTSYIFLGYGQFANYIIKTMGKDQEEIIQREPHSTKKKGTQILKDVKTDLNSKIMKRLQNEFDSRLIVIDEVHNIRKTDDNENKKVAVNLELLVKAARNMRFLLLSATPMYNSYKEIVWLLNLMNTNDRRGRIDTKDIFDKKGDFKKNGEDMLIRKATGYISFVRGENPYTFPYRVYPNEFAKEHTFSSITYPSYQMNLKKIKHEDKKRILSVYLVKLDECSNCGKCQYCAYKYIINSLRHKVFSITTKTGVVRNMPSFENMESFGYTLLQVPLESLIISYPIKGLKNLLDEIPTEKLSEEFSPSFSETIPIDEDEIINPREDEGNEDEGNEDEGNEDEGNEDEGNDEQPSPRDDSTIADTMTPNQDVLSDTEDELTKCRRRNDKLLERLKQCDMATNDNKVGGAHIEPNQLTGKIGLERMMTFIDDKSPPSKGKFEYKKTTLDNYGKIFSRDVIGQYSAKIKNILDNIYNPETNKVSDGIILIYSQYIDGGLVPMALALEEMGFTRYGQGVKPLFKNKPSEVVDVRTMKEPENKKQFMPARYAMITGDPRLSPNNVFEVNGLTSEDNKDGNKIKVVLISRAGSEGIDLKFIRQVHILEPWYNTNRIEQVIGRAVRNFSHKDLPFEKRNVEIFMYGTILGDNRDESADLYVYRVAEYKAIQIGKVTRALKESAVDCIINHDQTKFTQTSIGKYIKEPITQELSNGMILNDFKIGDAPFSPACDYMAECNYDCRPDKEINEDDLNQDTYSESFIIMNSEKILQRIRMLMKESFFYKKEILLKEIRIQKEYPYVQIYSALSQLIDDENEFITDKYGRNGHLINIGEYYLFQPIELRDKNSSIFDRSVPIDYKHDMINFELKSDISKQDAKKKHANNVDDNLVITDNSHSKKIMDDMTENYNTAIEFSKKSSEKVPRGDKNWYKHCGIVMRKISIKFPITLEKDYLRAFLVAHIIESLLFEDKIVLMDYLYSLDNINKGTEPQIWYAKEYFETNSIQTANFRVFIMYKLHKRIITILNENNKWVEAEPEDAREIAESKNIKEVLAFTRNEYNEVIGFMGYGKNNTFIVFKTKNIKSIRDTGARCEDATKNKIMQQLNEILGETTYTRDSTKVIKDEDGNIISDAIKQIELCVLQEFILRYFNEIRKDAKKWFLSPEMFAWYKL